MAHELIDGYILEEAFDEAWEEIAELNFNGARIVTTAGTGAGQARIIYDYNTSQVASIAPNWTTNPDATTEYEIQAADTNLALLGLDRTALTNALADYDGTGRPSTSPPPRTGGSRPSSATRLPPALPFQSTSAGKPS